MPEKQASPPRAVVQPVRRCGGLTDMVLCNSRRMTHRGHQSTCAVVVGTAEAAANSATIAMRRHSMEVCPSNTTLTKALAQPGNLSRRCVKR